MSPGTPPDVATRLCPEAPRTRPHDFKAQPREWAPGTNARKFKYELADGLLRHDPNYVPHADYAEPLRMQRLGAVTESSLKAVGLFAAVPGVRQAFGRDAVESRQHRSD